MIAAQMDAERKRAQAQYVIENDGSLDELEAHAHDVFVELRRRAAGKATGTLLLCAADAKDDARTVGAIAARYGDAGATVERASGKTAALAKALRALKPVVTIATDASRPMPGRA